MTTFVWDDDFHLKLTNNNTSTATSQAAIKARDQLDYSLRNLVTESTEIGTSIVVYTSKLTSTPRQWRPLSIVLRHLSLKLIADDESMMRLSAYRGSILVSRTSGTSFFFPEQ